MGASGRVAEGVSREGNSIEVNGAPLRNSKGSPGGARWTGGQVR